MLLLIYTFIASLIAFLIFAWDKRRTSYGLSPLPTGLLIALGVVAPFGSLMGMLLFCNRLNSILFVILVPAMFIIYTAAAYLLRGVILI